MVMSQSGTFQPAPLDGSEETTLEMGEWHGAAHLAEELVQKHWGDERGNRLKAHHRTVANLVSRHGWAVARRYDISVRRKAAHDPKHDLATLDAVELTVVISEVNQAPPSLPSAWSIPGNGQFPASRTSWNSGGKRPRTFDDGDSRPTKHPRQVKCFRCGSSGHPQAKCRATTTSAGIPCAGLVTRNGAPTLVHSNGSQFCFNWARGESRCPFGSRCVNLHTCSLCGAKDHGATTCARHL